MSTATATRYSVQHDSDGWHLVAPDKTVVGTYPNRQEAREAKRVAEAQPVEVDPEQTEAEHAAVDNDNAAQAEADAERRGPSREDVTTAVARLQAELTHPAMVAAIAEAGGVVRVLPRTDVEERVEASIARAATPKVTHESALARKLEPGHRIVLRGVGTVEVTHRTKVPGQQYKVRVCYRSEDGVGSRELWVNSRYRLV